MRYRIVHRTVYTYEQPAYESFNEVRLHPVSDEYQTCLDFSLSIDPPSSVITFRDYYGNVVHDFGVPYLHDRLTIEATSEVVTFADPASFREGPAAGSPDDSPKLADLRSDTAFADEHAEFLTPSAYIALGPSTDALANALFESDPGMSALALFERAATRVHELLAYQVGATTVHSTVDEVLAGGSGVCQDFAHLVISICRHLGLPARYVSGYLGDVASSNASHAWAEAFIPPYGWVGMDATSGTRCTGRHVKVAVGRDYADVAVVRGTYRGGSTAELDVTVSGTALAGATGFVLDSGSRRRGELIQYQSLGTLKQRQRLGLLSQTIAAMAAPVRVQTQTGLDFAPAAHEEYGDRTAPRQQPQQQQQRG